MMPRLSPDIIDWYDEEIVCRMMDKYGYDEKSALEAFVSSKTYSMLANPEMNMCEFGPEAIFNIWESERITGTPLRSPYLSGN